MKSITRGLYKLRIRGRTIEKISPEKIRIRTTNLEVIDKLFSRGVFNSPKIKQLKKSLAKRGTPDSLEFMKQIEDREKLRFNKSFADFNETHPLTDFADNVLAKNVGKAFLSTIAF